MENNVSRIRQGADMTRNWLPIGMLVLSATTLHAQVTQQWAARYRGPSADASDRANAIAVDGLGHVYVTGQSYNDSSTRLNYATVAYDAATGAQLWVARYEGPGISCGEFGCDVATGIAVDGLGQVYVTGRSPNAAGAYGYATVAYDATTGTQLWVARYDIPNSHEYANAIAVDGLGHVFVTGRSYNVGTDGSNNYATVAYDAATGTELWVAQYYGPRNNSVAAALAVDGLGHVYVTGWSYGDGIEYATVAYDAMTGTQLWVARYNANGGAAAIAVDGLGQVYVTGSSAGIDGHFRYVTVAYDAATGTELWAARYIGPAGNDYANGIAVDGLGHVYVTGASDDVVAPGRDYATVAYDATTGAQLWAARYDGGSATAIAVDGFGHVCVTGYLCNGCGYGTVAYDPMTGTQLWVARYPPGGGGGVALALAVDGLGNVYVTGFAQYFCPTCSYPWEYATVMYSQP